MLLDEANAKGLALHQQEDPGILEAAPETAQETSAVQAAHNLGLALGSAALGGAAGLAIGDAPQSK